MQAPHRLAPATSAIKRRPLPTGWIRACVVLFLMAVGIAPALAINGTWIDTTSGGLWSTTGIWSGGIVANGTDGIADFSTLNITADDTVRLDTARTIGQLKFGDTTPSNNWILDNNGVATNVLTLGVSSGSSTITVNNDTATINLVLAGTQGFTKSGVGELMLDDGNTFTGGVSVSAGTLAMGDSGALGSTSNTVNVIAGATLDLGGQAIGANPLTISGTGVGGNGALVNSSASTASYAGTITATGPFTVGGSGNITLSGSVNGGNQVLTKIGNNTLTLSGTTDNNGLAVTVDSGTVVLAKTSSGSPNDVHAIGENTLTVNGGTAQLGGTGGDQIYDLGSVTVTSGTFDTNGRNETFATLNLQGTGIGGAGALVNSAAAFSAITPTGGTTLTGNATIGVTQSSGELQLNNAIGGNFALTKTGSGTLLLAGNNTFTGGVTISNGTLALGSAGALGSTANSVSVSNGATLDLAGQTIGANPLTLTANGVGNNGALINSSSNPASYAGTVTLDSPTIIGDNGQITLSGSVVSNTLLTKNGGNTLILSGTTNNSGQVVVNSGTVILAKTSSGSPNDVHAVGGLALTINGGTAQLGGTGGDQIVDSASVTVNNGTFDTNGRNETFATLNLQGTGGLGALANEVFNVTSAITPTNGTVLTGNAAISVGFDSGLTLNNAISGNFALTKVGQGELNLYGTNSSFNGGLAIQNGSLLVNTVNNAGTNGPLGNNSSVTLGSAGQNGELIYEGNSAACNMPFVLAPGGTGGFFVGTVGVNLNLSGVISGAGTFDSDVGIVTLSGNNTFTGGVSIGGGTLQLGNPGALNSATPNAVTFTQGSTGALNLNGVSVTVSGLATNASVGTPVVQDANAASATLTVNSTGAGTFAGTLQNGTGGGSLGLTLAGGGTLTLSGNNTFSGGLVVQNGNILVSTLNNAGTNGPLGNNTSVTLGAAGQAGEIIFEGNSNATSNMPFVVAPGATGDFFVGVVGVNLNLTGAISGNGALYKSGPGTLTLSGNDTFNGLVIINSSSTLQVGGPAAFSSNMEVEFFATAGTFSLAGNSTTIGLLAAGGSPNNAFVTQNGGAGPATLTINMNSFTGNAPYVGLLQDGGAGSLGLVITGNTGNFESFFNSNNTFTGGLAIRQATLQIFTINNAGTTGVLGNNSSVTLGSSGQIGTLEYSGSTASSNMPFTLASGGTGALQVDTAATDLTLSGVISGAGALAKTGPGTLTLGGNNTFTGGVTINGGNLQVGNPGALNSSPPNFVTFGASSSGTLSLNGNSVTIIGLFSNSGAPVIQNGNTGAAATLTINNDVFSEYGGTLQDGAGSAPLSLVKNGNGIINLIGATLNFTGSLTINAGDLEIPTSNSLTGGITINGSSVLELIGGGGGISPDVVTFGPGGTGTLSVGVSGTIGGLNTNASMVGAPVVMSGAFSSTLTINNATSNTYAGVIQDGAGTTLSLAKSGAGALTLGGNNTFTGTTTVNAGTLILGNANALGGTAGGTIVTSGATLDLGGQAVGAEPLIISGTGVGGNGALINTSATAASFAGVINAGLFNLNDPFSVGGTGDINLSGSINGDTLLTKISNNTLTLSGTTDNFGLSLNVAAGTVILAKTSRSSPNDVHAVGQFLNVNGGTAQLGGTGGDQIYDLTPVGVRLGAFDTNGRNETFATLALQGPGIGGAGALVNTAAAASTLNLNNTLLIGDANIGVTQTSGSLTINEGAVLGNFTLTKVGAGTLTFINQNSSSCPINVNGGTLVIGGGTFTGNLNNSAAVTLNGGTFAGPLLTNAGTFTYNGGTFTGRMIVVGGTLTTNAPFTIGNGLENDGGLTLGSGSPITLAGAGLDNEGTLTLAGGTLILSTTPSAANVNHGTLNLSPTIPFNLNGATLTNGGALTLNGGTVNGTGLLSNSPGGVISGPGTILSPFSNAGGLLAVTTNNVNISQAFINSGDIQLMSGQSGTASLVGGSITNSNMIQGAGSLGNPVTNNGTIQALGGTLFVNGTLTNAAGGLLTAGAGNQLVVTPGLAANAGLINLTGGTFDNGGHPLNNTATGEISGWGIFRTGGTGLDNNGSVTFSGGLTTVNGSVTNENGQTITVAYNPAIFTGLVTNNGGGTFNIISTTAVFAGGSSGSFNGTFTNNANSTFNVGGSGTIEVDGPPTLGNSSSLAVGDTSTLRFKATTGAASVGTAVTATVASGATLELAGSVSALSSGANRVNITNNSSSAGILVSGTNQQVGNIDGSGTTQVNAGSGLTANHIIQTALVIGGTAGSHGLVTIDASDASGNPFDGAQGGPLDSVLTGPLVDGTGTMPATFSSELLVADSTPPIALSGSVGAGNSLAPSTGSGQAVPEPSTVLLALLALCGLGILLNSQRIPRRWIISCFVVGYALAAGHTVQATNGTWTNATSGGLWSATSNWSGGTVANGISGVADFSTLNITADDTVHLDSARTIGQLKFGNTGLSSNNWILDNNGNSANTLTMQVSFGNPQIAVNGTAATLDLGILGNSGTSVVTSGTGVLVLGGTTDNVGLGLTVTSGSVDLDKTSSSGVHAIGGGGLTVSGGYVLIIGSGGDQIYDSANVTVTSGAVDTGGQRETFNVLSLAGTGFGGNGALLNSTTLASTITPTGGTVLTANATIGVTQSTGELQLNNAIGGNFALTKTGLGTFDLEGTNTFSGGLTVQQGTLSTSQPINNASTNGVLGNNSSVTLGSSGQTGTFEVFASGTTNMPFTLAAGGIGAFRLVLGTNLQLSGAIGGTGALLATGSGTLTLSGNNTFTGGVTIQSGTLRVGSATALGNTSNSVSVSGGATLDLGGQAIGANPLTISGTGVGGNGALINSSSGPASFAGTVNATGPFTVGGSGNITLSGSVNGGNQVLTKIGNNTLTLSGMTDNNGLAVTVDSGTVVLAKTSSGSPNDVHAIGENTLTVNGGTAQLGGTGGDQIYDLGSVAVTSGSFDTNGRNETFANLSLQGTGIGGAGALVNSAAAFSVITPTGGTTLTGTATIGVTQSTGELQLNNAIGGNFGLGKTGSGTLLLAGNNTFTGGSGVLAGTLALGNAGALGSNAVSVNAGATLDLGGQAIGANGLIISGTGVGGNGALINSSSSVASFAGTVNASGPFTVGGTGDITLSGSVNGGNQVLTKIGNNTLTLSGTTDNNGLAVTVDSGTVVLAKTSSASPNDVHAIGENTLTVNGGTAQLGGTGGDQIYDFGSVSVTSGSFDTNGRNETFANLSLQGTGIGGTGALVNSAAAFSVITPTGGTTLTGNTTIGVTQSTGSLTLNDGTSVTVALTKVGAGTLVLNGNPTLNANSLLLVNGGTLRFNVVSGAATIGTGVTATIASGATLELAGSVSTLSSGGNRVNILNTSAAPGVLVSGTHQQVGNIDGSGTTQVSAGSDLTANHIIQTALVIGGTAGSHGLVTIDASDASGNSLGQSSGLALADSLTPSSPFAAGGMSSANLRNATIGSEGGAVLAMGNPVGSNNLAPVPEPSTLPLALLAVLGVVSAQFVRHHFRFQTV